MSGHGSGRGSGHGSGRADRHDAVVVGGGAAGLAAATWLARYRRDVLVVDSEEYRAERVESTHGYLGNDPLSPMDFLASARADVLRYPTASWLAGRVTGVRRDDADVVLTVSTAAGERRIMARRVVLATGVADAFPDVPGFWEHYGASAFHCPSCDGYEACGKDVVALGWDARLAGFATTLLDWASSVTVVTAGHRFEGDQVHCEALARCGIEIVERRAVELVGSRGDLRGVRLDDGRELPAALLFFSVDHRPRVGLARALGCEIDAEGYVVVDGEGATSVPGVYAAGDVVPGVQLVQIAAAKGTVAGIAAALSFHGEAGVPSSPPPAPDVEAVSADLRGA